MCKVVDSFELIQLEAALFLAHTTLRTMTTAQFRRATFSPITSCCLIPEVIAIAWVREVGTPSLFTTLSYTLNLK